MFCRRIYLQIDVYYVYDIFKSHHVGPMVCLEHHTIYVFSFLSLFKLTGRQEQTRFQNNGTDMKLSTSLACKFKLL